jgi:putative PEP-CTERM system histidine kinase
VLGVLIMGDRVSGLSFTDEEFDLIRTIGNQIVANLLSIKLASRLGEAQKLEAFQTMSAFFVHDLKNTASTLSLMLQNLPKHFDDPVFRQDALRAIGKSVGKINALVARLSCFRQKLDVKPVPTDLNALVKSVLAGLSDGGPETVSTELRPLPLLMADPDQVQKVITNLVLNAREASGPGGRISIRTEARGRGGVLSVSDNGCGMTPEFVEQLLFRPFQTTKKEGLGIGLFHSKMIVDAHRGQIEVESRQGEGTTFRVFLAASGDKT